MAAVTPTPPETETLRPPQLLDLSGLIKLLFARRGWLVLFILVDIYVVYQIITNAEVLKVWYYVLPGLGSTIRITILSFVIAIVVGLIVALGRISKNIIVYNLATFYVEIFVVYPSSSSFYCSILF